MCRFMFFCLSWLVMASPAGAGEPPIILVFGDSLSAGYGMPVDKAWPGLLAQRLHSAQLSANVVNASLSGETTAGGRSRLPEALRRHRPTLVVIELGANDGLRGLPLATMKSNLQEMIAACRAAGAKVVLAGMRLPPNFGPEYSDAFERSFGELARKESISLVPFLLQGVAQRWELFQADGLHPTAEAQPLIVDNVWPVLKRLLGR